MTTDAALLVPPDGGPDNRMMPAADAVRSSASSGARASWAVASIAVLLLVFLPMRGVPMAVFTPALYVIALVLAMQVGRLAWLWGVTAMAAGLILLAGPGWDLPSSMFTNPSDALERLGALLVVFLVAAMAHAMLRLRSRERLAWQRGDVAHAAADANGRAMAVPDAVSDIDAHKQEVLRGARLKQVYRMVSQINAAIVGIRDRQQLFDTACSIAVESGGICASWIGLVDPASHEVQVSSKAGAIDDYLESIRISTLAAAAGNGPFGVAVRENRAVVCNDIDVDPDFAPWRAPALQMGYRSVAVFPLRSASGLSGAVVFYADAAGYFDAHEQRLLSDLVDGLSFATGNIMREQALRRSDARFRAVFEQAPLGICLVAKDNRFLRVNAWFCQLLGYSEQELLEQLDCIETTHPEDRDGDREAKLSLQRGEPRTTREKRYLHKDGSVVWGRLTLALFQSTDCSGSHYLGMVQDVTRQRLVEEDLRHSQTLVRITSDISRLGAWKVLLPERTLVWSDALRQLAEVPDAEQPSLTQALAFIDEPYRDTVETSFKACLGDGIAFDIEVSAKTAKGRSVWVRLIGESEKDASGDIVRVHGACKDISALKQAELGMVRSLERFRQMVTTMPLIVWTVDVSGMMDFFSMALCSYAGRSETELLADGLIRLLHPDDQGPIAQAWVDSLASGQPYSMEMRLRRHDAVYRWHLIRGVPARDADGKIVKWYGSATDIHDQKSLEQESRQLATRLTRTIESISDAFLTVDRSWRISYMNNEAARLLRLQPDDVLGRDLWESIPPSPGSQPGRQFQRDCRRALHDNLPLDFEHWYTEGESLLAVRVYPSEEGLAFHFRDITAQRKADSQLRLLETAVSRLSDIVVITEAAPIDAPGPRIVFVNDAFEWHTGYTREEVISQTPRILQGPGTQRSELDRIREALTNWTPVRAELLNYKKNGEPLWLEVDIVPIANASGWFTHWVAVQRDVTERRMLEEQLRQSQRLEAVGQLTGGMAHDFNNLLTVIMGNAEMLADELPADGSLRELARMIEEAAQRGADLTQSLLAFARRQPLEPRAVDVNGLIAGMDALLRRTLGEHIEIAYASGQGLWSALVDPAQLESALLNLCLNARDAMLGGGWLTVETSNQWLDQEYADRHVDLAAGPYVMLAVSDTGVGIAPEILRRVVEPFFTTKEMGKGSGLGLSMVYGFVKQSRGHVSIYSELGQGTTVKMYLPRVERQLGAGPAKMPTQVDRGTGTILLVEDDELVRRYACGQLVSLGYQVIEASDGPQALHIIEQDTAQAIDLLFTDVVMPGGMNGRALADAAHVLRPALPVLFTSGYTENVIVHHGRLDGGVQLLGKPYRRAELARRVREALGGQATG